LISARIMALEVVQMLLDKGVNPTFQLKLRPPYRNVVFHRGGDQVLSTGTTGSANGQTAMHATALKGSNATIRFLGVNTAELEAKDRDGKTPVDFASGNYKPAFGGGVNAPPTSFPETVKLLKDLIAKAAAPWA